MVNVVAIVVSVVVALVIIVVSFYLFSMYCHRKYNRDIAEEQGFGNALFPKILVILSQALAWGQVLLLPLDLSVNGNDPDTNFNVVYYIYYPIVFFITAFLNPFAMFFYESDESQTIGSRIGWSFLFAFIVTAIWSAYIFISYIWVGLYTFQGNQYRLDLSMYIFLVMSLVGWVLLAFNGGIGIIYLPVDLIKYFINRPKPLTTQQALIKKQQIQVKSNELITEGEKLKTSAEQLSHFEGGWLSKKRAESKFNNLVDSYKKKINRLQLQYEVFDTELKIRTVHPVMFVVALIGGIFASIVSFIWVIQIMGTMILQKGEPLFLFIDQWLASMSAGNAGFVATLIYGVFVFYMQVCIVKGNTIFGIRIPYILKMHPMLLNKTYMNSLLFNCNLMLLASLSTSLLAIWAFPTYLASTYMEHTSVNAFQNEPIFNALYKKRIAMILMFCVVILCILIKIAGVLWRRFCGKSDKKTGKDQK